MILALWFLLIAFPLTLFWTSSRAAAETANRLGQQLCQRANVIWLDQSTHQIQLRIKRNAKGRMQWQRVFQYEYSQDGQNRYAGTITLLGKQLVGYIEPIARGETI